MERIIYLLCKVALGHRSEESLTALHEFCNEFEKKEAVRVANVAEPRKGQK